jgi:hypothetical protein
MSFIWASFHRVVIGNVALGLAFDDVIVDDLTDYVGPAAAKVGFKPDGVVEKERDISSMQLAH